MKGVNKCFWFYAILMAVLPALFSASLPVNVSALKHDVKAIPIYSDYIFTGGSTASSSYSASNPGFSILWNNQYSPSNFHPVINTVFYSKYLSNSSLCGYMSNQYNNGYWSYSWGSDYGFNYRFSSYRGFVTDSSYPDDFAKAQCQQTFPFGTANPNALGRLVSNHPSFDSSTIPNNQIGLSQLLPYYYDYSHFYVSGTSVTSANTGISYYSNFKMSDISSDHDLISKFSYLRIPLGTWNESKEGALTSGRSIEFHGMFNFPGVTSMDDTTGFSWASDFITNGTFRLEFDGANHLDRASSLFYGENADCSLTRIYTESSMQLEYTCSLTLSRNYEQASMYIEIKNYGSYIFETTSDWTWSGFYVTTDHDSTPGADFNDDPTGNNLDVAPGNPYSIMNESEGDDGNFFDHLVNLFGFSFINPFAPLFTMFTDSSTCANIPIIAGMLHANESSYCSWFSSDTRTILTPVLSISAMMLVFGFAVRWLSSSSGNMFEDQTTHKASNTQPKGGA